MDELYAVAAEARSEAGAANERISALDDYDARDCRREFQSEQRGAFT